MKIDDFYSNISKSEFYLGIISQVFRSGSYLQVENLSLLQYRKIYDERLLPNTINYYVVIDDIQGLFFGEIYQSRVQNTSMVREAIREEKYDSVFPELAINIIGIMKNERFELPGFKTVGVNDKVYVANKELIRRYMKSLPVHQYFKHAKMEHSQLTISGFANFSKFNNVGFEVQPNVIFDRHLMVVGTTNSGKSTSSLAILDKMIDSKKKMLIIDPTGEYRDAFQDENVKRLKLGENVHLSVGKVANQQWEMLFQINGNTQGAVLAEAIESLRYQKSHQNSGVYKKDGRVVQDVQRELMELQDTDTDFDLKQLARQINEDSVEIYKQGNIEKYRLQVFRENTNEWLVKKVKHELNNTTFLNFFTNQGCGSDLLQQIDEFLLNSDESLYIDASNIGTTDGVGTMIIDLICNYIINRDKDDIRPFVLFVDEVHRYTRFVDSENESLSGLTSIAREGRKKGVFLFLTTQSPNAVPKILLGQIGTLIIHRLTGKDELEAIHNYLDEDAIKQVRGLNKGEAVLTSINLLQDVYLKFIKSKRIHHNETPVL